MFCCLEEVPLPQFYNIYECQSEEAPLLKYRSISVTGGASSIIQIDAKRGASSAI
jgi:hypothetical protein